MTSLHNNQIWCCQFIHHERSIHQFTTPNVCGNSVQPDAPENHIDDKTRSSREGCNHQTMFAKQPNDENIKCN